MESVFAAHIKRYPRLESRDLIKLAYQSEFGPGHLVKDAESARKMFFDELEISPPAPLFERIGGGLCRLNLGGIKGSGLLPETAFKMFLFTASRPRGSREGLEKRLSLIAERQAVEEYLAVDAPMVSHSEAYRKLYNPHYRVVDSIFADFYHFFAALQNFEGIAAIDGRAGAGKSTLAEAAAGIFDLNLFHADDFFLPPEMKTPERLSAPGGNVHFERIREEIISPLLKGKDVEFRRYDCFSGALLPPERVSFKPKNLIEGAYSHHPALKKAYSLKLFLGINPDLQRRRILLRNGADMLSRFESEWIPLEEKYIKECKTEEKADFVYTVEEDNEIRIQHPRNLLQPHIL